MAGSPVKRRFNATEATTTRDLVAVMRKLGAANLKVEQDLFKGDVTIRFDRNGTRYGRRSAQYKNTLDNFRAAQLTIEYLYRALEQYGVTQSQKALDQAFAQFFLGFEATPDDTALLLGSGEAAWWDVLGVERTADRAAITPHYCCGVTNAFRALAKSHHPDAGGDPDDFKRLRAAYEAGLKERAG